MRAAPPETEYRVWRAEGHLLRIEFSPSVVEEICGAAVDGLLKIKRGGVEVGGVLFGSPDGDLVRILAYRPIACEHAHGPSFVLSNNDRLRLAELLESTKHDPGLRGLVPVGWYHSHTRSEIFLSEEDLEIYRGYFPDPRQVAMVVQPALFGPARVGFFFRERDGAVEARRTYREISVTPRRSVFDGVEETQPVPQKPVPHNGKPAAIEESPPAPLPPPSFSLIRPRASRKRVWIAAALCVALAGGIGATLAILSWLDGRPSPVSLQVRDHDGQLRIEWDRASRTVRQAPSAALEIRDGSEIARLRLDAVQLREGSVVYGRRSERVDVWISVERPGAQSTEESVQFLGPPVAPSARELEAARQAEELRQELEELRARMKGKDALIRELRGRSPAEPAAPPRNPR